MSDTIKSIAQAMCGIATPCDNCGSRRHCEITMLKATDLYIAHIKPLEEALARVEADKVELAEAFQGYIRVICDMLMHAHGNSEYAVYFEHVRDALARVKGEV